MIDGPQRLGTADLHLHTTHGDGMATVPQLLDWVQERTALDVVAFTEHDDFRAAEEALNRHARDHFRFEVIAGSEITTIEGHLVALFIERPIPSFKSLAWTIEEIHRQGGLAIAPHPMSPFTRSIGRNGLTRIHHHASEDVYLDGMEGHSRSPSWAGLRDRVQRLTGDHGLAVVGGSDAHFAELVGAIHTTFPGRTAADLRQAIADRTTAIGTTPTPSLRDLGVTTILCQQVRGLCATPRNVGRRVLRRLTIAD